MAVTEAFLAACRAAVEADPALAAFRAAYAAYDAAPRAAKGRYWALAFDDAQAGLSPAYRVKQAVRGAVAALADATVTAAEREEAYRTLAGAYAPAVAAPPDPAAEAAALQQLLTLERLS